MKLTDEQIDALLKNMELDEPSMSFNRNVMERVKLEAAPASLKTRVDTRIIYSIAAFFILCIVGGLVYVMSNTTSGYSIPKMSFNLDLKLDKTISPHLLKGFLMVDAVIALIWLDRVLRRKQA
ncbi:MAG TPA: hypothetical protein VKB19_07085 [Pedobacter sp.]|nr:hypothetical protein [Pedobacter sp.]